MSTTALLHIATILPHYDDDDCESQFVMMMIVMMTIVIDNDNGIDSKTLSCRPPHCFTLQQFYLNMMMIVMTTMMMRYNILMIDFYHRIATSL